MNSISKSLLSILALAFALWAAWIAYNLWKGQPAAGEFHASLLIIVFLVLSCTYFITSAIQQASEVIARKESEFRKVILYEEVLSTCLAHLMNAEKNGEDKFFEKLDAINGQMVIHANIRVIQAFNKITALFEQQDRNEELMSSFTRLMLAIRSDLGRSNISMKPELESLLKHYESGE